MRNMIFGGALALGLLAQPALAVIQVGSLVTTAEGVRAQAVITNPTSVDSFGAVTTAIAIKEFRATIIIRDDVDPPRDSEGGPGLLVQKHQLTSAQAWGAAQVNGYDGPPTNHPTPGAWQGLVWPYRDQYDYFQTGGPFADDIGSSFFDPPDVYGFLNVVGIARGGPSEPDVPFPGQGTPAWLNRGITGNGADLDNPATYFWFDILPNTGDPNRFVRLQIIAASAVVVTQTGDDYGELTVPVPDFQFEYIQLPEPGVATVGLMGAIGVLVRRRRA